MYAVCHQTNPVQSAEPHRALQASRGAFPDDLQLWRQEHLAGAQAGVETDQATDRFKVLPKVLHKLSRIVIPAAQKRGKRGESC